MIIPFASINPNIVEKAKKKYKGWSREKFLEAAIAALHPESPRGKGTLHVAFRRVVEINEGSLSRRQFVAALIETESWFSSALIHEFTPEESRVIRAQKIYWEVAQKFRSSPCAMERRSAYRARQAYRTD